MTVDALIQKISHALARESPGAPASKPQEDAVLQKRRAQLESRDLLSCFQETARFRGSQVLLCQSHELQDKLIELLAEQESGPLLAPTTELILSWSINPDQLGRELLIWETGADLADYILQGEQAPVSLSVALAGVADKGMLLQAASPDQPRSLSLLPPVHISLLAASTIVSGIAQAMVLAKDDLSRSSQALFVAGPSTTGDIENVIVTGVHGPMAEIIIVVEDR